MAFRHTIVRSRSFYDTPALVFDVTGDITTLRDNSNNIIAFEKCLPVEAMIDFKDRWNPFILNNVEEGDESYKCVIGNRVFYLKTICDCIDEWHEQDIITENERNVLGDIIRAVFFNGFYFNENFFFPNVYDRDHRVMFSGNIQGFIAQFPSDPFIIDLLDSITVETFPVSDSDDDDVLSFPVSIEIQDWIIDEIEDSSDDELYYI